MNLKKILQKIFFTKRYLYVPPCPHCGSKKTGYIINSFNTIQQDLDLEKIKKLLNGELVELNKFVLDENTLFCNECHIQWIGEPTIKYLTEKEIEIEKQNRGITDEYIYLRNDTKRGKALMRTYVKQKQKEERKKIKEEQSIKVKQKEQKVKIKK